MTNSSTLVQLVQRAIGPTTPPEKGLGSIKTNPFKFHATEGITGLAGFESPGEGCGRTNRGYKSLITYDNDAPSLVTWQALTQLLNWRHPLAKKADKLFEENFKETRNIFESSHNVIQALAKKFYLKPMSLYPLDEPDININTRIVYTYNWENPLTQDIQFYQADISYKDEELSLYAIIFHTGVDARCGFSGPVFAVMEPNYLEDALLDLYKENAKITLLFNECPVNAENPLAYLQQVISVAEKYGLVHAFTNTSVEFYTDYTSAYPQYEFYEFIDHLPEIFRYDKGTLKIQEEPSTEILSFKSLANYLAKEFKKRGKVAKLKNFKNKKEFLAYILDHAQHLANSQMNLPLGD